MRSLTETNARSTSRKRSSPRNHGRERILTWLFPLAGLFSLIWFLVRVLPKPSRAAYPCQRAAVPLAGGFVLWLGGILGSWIAFRKARTFVRQARVPLAVACVGLAAVMALIAAIHAPDQPAQAHTPTPNAPIGTAQGLHPGRVVWAHDPNATDWAGVGDGHWWQPNHTSQAAVDAMMSQVIRGLAGETTDAAAWDALIRHFNRTHGKGDVGYQTSEKIAIKVNFVGNHQIYPDWGGCNPANHNLDEDKKPDYMNTSPQVMLALLRQLVYNAGVPQGNIYMGDPTCFWADPYFDYCHGEFPDVHYMEFQGPIGGGTEGREGVTLSSVRVYWSSRPTGVANDYLPTYYADASYFINLANLKSHTSNAGVTLCGKNHYGSLTRWPAQSGYYDIHSSLPAGAAGMGRYRALVDLMGHAHTGGKGLLFLIDGLYAGRHPVDLAPTRWLKAPFNNDWTSSLFASQDQVAIDSVAFDFLHHEWPVTSGPDMNGAEDYLHEAAQANNPPSGTFYDPNHLTPTARLPNLGVHEHWNNPTDKQYSRNLGTGQGIEFLRVGPPTAVVWAQPAEGLVPLTVYFDGSASYDADGTIVAWAWDFDGDGTVDDDSGPVVSHAYARSGPYTARLTVTDNEGKVSSATAAVVVRPYPGDFNDDFDVDQEDFGQLQACLSGASSPPSECRAADLNGDQSVNQTDVAMFAGCLSGPQVQADPDCLP